MLGEDSGIEAAALGGRPGIESARWADDGVAQLLAELDGSGERRARYVCSIVCLTPEGEELRGTGTLEGTIAAAPRGDEGFGYDPIFVPEGETKTVAELGNDWKRRHSHRARAAAAARLVPLGRVLGQSGDLLVVAPSRVPPVDLRAEDDHVRHHVDPDEQQRRGAERLHRDHLGREANEERQHLEGGLQQHRAERCPGQTSRSRRSAFVSRS